MPDLIRHWSGKRLHHCTWNPAGCSGRVPQGVRRNQLGADRGSGCLDEKQPFLLLVPSFALLAWAIWCAQWYLFNGTRQKFQWQVPFFLLGLIALGSVYFHGSGQGSTWFFVLLALTVVMSSLMLTLLTRHAWKYQLKGSAFLFLLHLAIAI